MKIQMRWLLFMLCANIVSGVLMNLTTEAGEYVVPGTSQALNQTGQESDYEETMNATDMMANLEPPSGLTYTSYIYTSVFTFYRMVSWLWDGFPQMIRWWAGYIPSEAGADTLVAFGVALTIINLFMFSTILLEFIRGVQILP